MLPIGTIVFAFVGLFAGIWKIGIVVVAVGLYGYRAGWWKHPLVRLLRLAGSMPPPRAAKRKPTRPKTWHDHWPLILLFAALATAAAWVATRISISAAFR